MTRAPSIGGLILGLALAVPSAARAQASTQTTPFGHFDFLNISGGGQIQTRQISYHSTFKVSNETAVVDTNQTINGGFVFDAAAGFHMWKQLALAAGVSTVSASGDAALAASVPNAAIPNHPTVFTATATGLHQNDVLVNLQVFWDLPVTSQIAFAVFFGPSFVHVSQEFATVTPTSGVGSAAIVTETGSTAKAGTAGINLRFKLNERLGLGAFARYAGGEVNLPLVQKMKVGGMQVGGGLRMRF